MRRLVRNLDFIAFPFMVFILLLAGPKASATSPEGIFDVLNYTEVLEIGLSFDLTSVLEKRREDKEGAVAICPHFSGRLQLLSA